MSEGVDSAVLSVFREPDVRGLVHTDDVAARLGLDVDEARSRLNSLVSAGFLAGPVLAAWDGHEWSEIGYGLMSKGAAALDDAP